MSRKYEIYLNTDEPETTEHATKIVDFGSEVIWTNTSAQCPHFEIVFEDSSPAKGGEKFTGTSKHPVSVRMPEEKKELKYSVHFKKADGTPCIYGQSFSIRICPGGHPC